MLSGIFKTTTKIQLMISMQNNWHDNKTMLLMLLFTDFESEALWIWLLMLVLVYEIGVLLLMGSFADINKI